MSFTDNPDDVRFPASRIAKLLGIDYPDIEPDPSDS